MLLRAGVMCANHSPSLLLLTPLRHPTCSTKCLTEHRHLPYFNSVLRASIEKGAPVKALSQFKAFLRLTPFRPDRRTFVLVLAACLRSSNLSAAMEAHARLVKHGFRAHASVATPLFHLYLKHDRVPDALLLLDDVFDDDGVDAVHGNLMIAKLLKSGQFDKANWVFKNMPVKDLVSWNSMIAGCVQNSRPKEALSFFERMVGAGLEPDAFSFSSVLSACARVGARGHGERMHRLMLDKMIELNYILSSALIDMYAKCGSIDAAKRVFAGTARDHVSIWNSMITGLAIHGLGSDAVELFCQMEAEGMTPDGVTFLAVLTACSHAGMVEEARNHFSKMKEVHGIEPGIEHYGATVDASARAGLLDHAYEMIGEMPMKPDGVIWRILLSACKRHHRPDLAEIAIDRMSTRGSGDYVLLSSIYSSARKWTRAEQVWDSMKENKVRKKRGLSWAEVGRKVHQFKAGDRSHPETHDIYRVLNTLGERLKIEGFQPMTELVSMDVLEEEREENLSVHSEKLAVAYCVLKTGPGSEIRVSKNLQTCQDCHEWMKVISKVLSRVILVRDRVRFHRFEKGICSCNDYW
ncbi:hypothetical protein Cni_G10491 [Canna indica]|uniref:DYW domain-containing protein n=1 Tax=Canna indica TaxID=4628 RepID=A0AAQ3K5V6_9LILI|nr:hypothetical protein Cni_G10491 [Canna indica]